MNIADFEAQLLIDGYDEITTVKQAQGYAMGEHKHPFDARALILEGEIIIVINGQSQAYPQGSIFELPANTVHLESAIPEGVIYRVGRRR